MYESNVIVFYSRFCRLGTYCWRAVFGVCENGCYSDGRDRKRELREHMSYFTKWKERTSLLIAHSSVNAETKVICQCRCPRIKICREVIAFT